MKSSSYIEKITQYQQQGTPDPYRPVEEYFQCQVRQMGSVMLPMLNGWFVQDADELATYPLSLIHI